MRISSVPSFMMTSSQLALTITRSGRGRRSGRGPGCDWGLDLEVTRQLLTNQKFT